MNISEPFIRRPVATILLTLALVVVGVFSFVRLEVSPLPQMSIPYINVSAELPGASPTTMSANVATPLQRALGTISGITSMNANSKEGRSEISIQFELSKDVDDAARQVQAAINKALPLMPSGMQSPPRYRKLNPVSTPIMTLALTSDTYSQDRLYDIATTVLSQKLSQIDGVADVSVGGSSLPAVRVDLNPAKLSSYNINLDELRAIVTKANQIKPRGFIESDRSRWIIKTNGQLHQADEFRDLVVKWKDNQAVRLGDIAKVYDSVEDQFNSGFFNDQSAVVLVLRRQESANIIKTVEQVKSTLPQFQELLPGQVDLHIAQDRTPTIRATLHETELTLIIAIILVVLVVLLFLRNARATFIPAISVPISLMGTAWIMSIFGFSLNNISLMALIVATGFVVDDSIVVVENITRYLEAGLKPRKAALRGTKEVGFTLMSMSATLIIVFLPLLLIGGLFSQLFFEFALTLSAAVMVSLVVSLTFTPMLCAQWLKAEDLKNPKRNFILDVFNELFGKVLKLYEVTLRLALRFRFFTLLSLFAVIICNVALFVVVPKGLFPDQDTGTLIGFFKVDKGTSFDAMMPKLDTYRHTILEHDSVESVMGFARGRGGSSSSFFMVQLKPYTQRHKSAQVIIEELNASFKKMPGSTLFLNAQKDLSAGGRGGGSGDYNYILKAGDVEDLKEWTPKVREALKSIPGLRNVSDDSEEKGRRIELIIDREKVEKLGVNMQFITSSLNNLYSQRQISRIYDELNQYNVVIGAEQDFATKQAQLESIMLITPDGRKVPLSSVAQFKSGNAPLQVRQTDGMLADAISFSLSPDISLEEATASIERKMEEIHLPSKQIQAGFDGNAEAFNEMQRQLPWMFLGVIALLYLVMGVLYESYIHPLTILSTLPSAGIGAILALLAMGMEFTLIAMIGIFLLVGVVKKNAIILIDFALAKQRDQQLSPEEAIFQACLVRFRPIIMTSLATICGGVPLILATGSGVEIRQPLGVVIVGGLLVSQVLTLYTIPVVYLYLDQLARGFKAKFKRRQAD